MDITREDKIALLNDRARKGIALESTEVVATRRAARSSATVISGGSDLGDRLIGSIVRAMTADDFPVVLAGLGLGGSEIHVDGGIVNVNGPISIGIRADASAFVHTAGTAFVLPAMLIVAAARMFAPSASDRLLGSPATEFCRPR